MAHLGTTRLPSKLPQANGEFKSINLNGFNKLSGEATPGVVGEFGIKAYSKMYPPAAFPTLRIVGIKTTNSVEQELISTDKDKSINIKAISSAKGDKIPIKFALLEPYSKTSHSLERTVKLRQDIKSVSKAKATAKTDKKEYFDFVSLPKINAPDFFYWECFEQLKKEDHTTEINDECN